MNSNFSQKTYVSFNDISEYRKEVQLNIVVNDQRTDDFCSLLGRKQLELDLLIDFKYRWSKDINAVI